MDFVDGESHTAPTNEGRALPLACYVGSVQLTVNLTARLTLPALIVRLSAMSKNSCACYGS